MGGRGGGWEGGREGGRQGGKMREGGRMGGREGGRKEERDMLASPLSPLSLSPFLLTPSLLSSSLPSSLSPLVYPAQRRGSKRGRFDEPPAKKHLFISLSRRGTSSEYAKGTYVGYW